jgi:hypothetical protein
LQKTVQPEDEQGGLERQIGLKLLAETGRSGRETTKSESGFNGSRVQRLEPGAGGVAMKMGKWARLLLAAAPLVAGCGDFWQAPGSSSSSFTLSNSGNISVSPGSTGTSTITVTPGSSFTGTVTLSCSVTTTPSSATDPTTCSLSPSSLTFSSTSAQTSTLTAATQTGTTLGTYDITVSGVSGSAAATTVVCVEVGTGTCSAPASTSGNFYILNSSSIAGYYINSGVLTQLTGSPISLPSGYTPYSMAVDPTGRFLYVGTSEGILLYDIGSGGELTQDTSVNLVDVTPNALQVDSTGHWLLDASNTSGQPTLYAWPISTSNGESTLSSGVNVPARYLVSGGNVGVGGLAISPDNKLVSVAVGSETQTFTFTSGTDFTGATNPISSGFDFRTAKGTAVSVAFGPSTNYLYIGETNVFPSSSSNSGGLRIIPITSDALGTEPSASPYQSGGTGPHAIVAGSNGYIYVANWVGTSAGNITAFLLNTTGPTLTMQSNAVATGYVPYGMVKDSTGDFVLVVNNQGSPYFNAYTFDSATTGKLDSSLTGSTGIGPVAIVAVP